MILLLDANVLIDIANGHEEVRARFDEAAKHGDRMVTCAIAAHELHYGAMISRRPEQQFARAETLLSNLPIEPWTFEDSFATSRIRARLRTRGRSIGAYDLLIAGQALNRGWTVVSHNLHEFERIEGLSVIDWTPSHPQMDPK